MQNNEIFGYKSTDIESSISESEFTVNPKIVRWKFKSLNIPMIDMGDGCLVCTSKQIEVGLGVNKDRLHQAFRNHREEMESLRCVLNIPKDFLLEHKEELGIERVREDLNFWTEDAAINFAFFVRTPEAVAFRKEFRTFIREHRSIYTSGLKEAQQDIRREFEEFKEFVLQALPSLEKSASLAGSVLQAQKGTKHLRVVS